ncbi:tetratricopeptide repeat protein 39B [Exaiptasia diaphana]|uniref:Tetratricopeptide repeat protein 39B n=1 Tax=Exaiptasia diaphana TaxID=2652724 RepID=A0A913WSM1_EXADI|nr:tetratricopeptide repeat protein 39B [Exaiptasia diaphana]KXJ18335.1 Tetratricopeptide repeat protein 39B [Exaiptasia diaphana]
MTEESSSSSDDASRKCNPGNETDLPDAIKTTAVAINLCLSNKFLKAQKLLEPWAKESMYHALGYGTIMYLQAVMTFEPQAIEEACESIKLALDVCDRQRRKQSWTESLSSWIWSPSYDKITEEERHAELCYAECLLQRALLTFIQDENLISFIRGALKIKACYHSYKTCHSMATNQSHDLAKSPQRQDFEGGVHLGIGSFNLLLSLLPTRILKILEYIGFSGDKALGLDHLDKGCQSQSLRSPMCAMILLAHHSVISYYLGIGDGDVEYADEVLQPFIKAFPKGAIFLYFAGRIRQIQGRLDEAEERYMYSIKVQSEWKQFHHICFWELMWCCSFQGNWSRAYHFAAVLLNESRWSKTTYMYLKASFKFMARITNQTISKEDNRSEEDSEEYMFRHLPDFKQRIAGKSIPFEKYSIHKAAKYLSQGNWLFLPGLELIYMWNGFYVLRRRPDLSHHLLNLVHKEQEKLEHRKDEMYYIDDWCLGKVLEGMCYQCTRETEKALQSLLAALDKSRDTILDKQLGAYACAEVGFLYMDQGKYVLAKRYLKTACHEYQGYFLESRLHFRIHAALSKLKKIEKEHKQARKAVKASKAAKNNNMPNDNPLSDTESDDSEGLSNYSTASEGEEEKFEDAYSDTNTNTPFFESNQIDGRPRSYEGMPRENTFTKSCTSHGGTAPINKLYKKTQPSQRTLQQPKGFSSPRVFHETTL